MTPDDEQTIRRIVREETNDILVAVFAVGIAVITLLLMAALAHAAPTPTPCVQPGRHHYPCSAPTPYIPMRTTPCPPPLMQWYHQHGKSFIGCQPGTLERSGGCSCVPTTDMRPKR